MQAVLASYQKIMEVGLQVQVLNVQLISYLIKMQVR